jgi:ParB family chromosome partitioning protein
MEPTDSATLKPVNISSVRRGLGRGLDALLPASPAAHFDTADAILQIGVSSIVANPHQPRQQFHPERLQELADSIKIHGIVQPVVVRRQDNNKYLLIAGERRWRAASLAGLATMPAIVRNVPDSQMLEMTLIENIQREELNPMEIAEALAGLLNNANLTHEQVAERTGKNRSTVTNYIRLLSLHTEVRKKVASGELSLGHAKVLMGMESAEAQKAFAERIVAQGLSVRQTEKLAKGDAPKTISYKAILQQAIQDPNVQAAMRDVERTLGTRVRLVGNEHRGKIVIEYHSPEDLDRIYGILVGRKGVSAEE